MVQGSVGITPCSIQQCVPMPIASPSPPRPGRDLIAPCRCKGSARFVHRHCLDQWRANKEGFAFCHCSTCKARFQLRVCLPPDLRCRHLKFRFFVARDIVLVTLLAQVLIICFGYTAYVADYYWFDMGFQKTWGGQSPRTFYYICGVLLFLVSAGLLGAVMTCVDRRFRSDLAAPCRDICACCCDPLVCGGCDCHMAPICLYSDCSGCSFCVSGCSDCAAAIGGSSGEAGLLILLTLGAILLVVLALVGVFYCLLVSTLVVQRIWQRHYHVLAKRILTKEFIVEDLSGMSLPPDWSPPPLLPEHDRQLRDLRLL
ncbi:unnamed protein product [Closterium sp. Yama58-4]|nr:unnamed protein product [Closterium sp. Yama58-4]